MIYQPRCGMPDLILLALCIGTGAVTVALATAIWMSSVTKGEKK